MILKGLRLYMIIAASLFTVGLLTAYSYQKGQNDALSNDRLPQVVKDINIDRPFFFADEQVPLTNFDVKERLERELLINSYLHATTLINLKRTYRYFPLIEKALKENNLPSDLKYFPIIESNLSNAVSSAGARGLWQFMKSSADYFGLEVNDEVDERYHIEKSTQAACKYLSDLKKRFGTWALVASAYNLGPTRLAKELELQGTRNFFDLNLPDETLRYYFRLIAVKDICQHPENYGFYLSDTDGYSELNNFTTVEVKTAVPSWADFAKEKGITYRMLKLYNPWLIDSKLTNPQGKTYEIKIPKK